jgi:hypothetical protein
MKRLVLAGLVLLGALGAIQISAPTASADPDLSHCAAVLCAPCPSGTVYSPTPGNCCRCIAA